MGLGFLDHMRVVPDHRQGGDVEPCLEAFGAGRLMDAPCGDGSERAEPLPFRMAGGEPACVGGAAGPLLDPAMTGVGMLLVRAIRGKRRRRPGGGSLGW
jgi:hypothetical protein